MRLPQEISDVDVLLALSPEELGGVLLKLAADPEHRGMFTFESVAGDASLYPPFHAEGSHAGYYPRARDRQITQAASEAWHWLEYAQLIMPAPGVNGRNGWKVLTRRGEAIAARGAQFGGAIVELPKALLHPLIAEQVWLQLARGDLAVAVFIAFRTVEEAVRKAGGYKPEIVGVALMRAAFDPKAGPLAKHDDPLAEREALGHLFAGAIGSYKNPHSHRTVEITDLREAQEMVLLASHLLRIVDGRSPDHRG